VFNKIGDIRMRLIGLVGDMIKDIYVYGECNRISPESPIPVFEQKRIVVTDGGSGNVARNLKSLGMEVEHYYSGQISEKTRYVVGDQIVFRSDKDAISDIAITDVEFSPQIKYVILSDYNKGFLADPSTLITNLNYKHIKSIVDIKKNIEHYRNAFIVKMNEREYNTYCKNRELNDLRLKYNIENIIVTLGARGSLVATPEGQTTIKTEYHQVSDVTGAGDVFISALAYFINIGESVLKSAEYATKLASLSVTKFGTYNITQEDLRRVKPRVVFTNGCFDLLHRGHVEYLQKSKELGDRLIVGINSDQSVKRLKGAERPLTRQEDRKELLENLKFVDEVIIFDEDTPYKLIQNLKPDIITKGGDYKSVDQVVGNDLAEVVLIPFVEGYSTTSIIQKVK
jgi:D-beta-D-heptose 7-phosphate kinase / D-beta-D-heptose 1-phosphate adenosyltransferase